MAEGGHYFIVKRKPRTNAAPQGGDSKLRSRFRLVVRWTALGLGGGVCVVGILWLLVIWSRPGPTKFTTVRVSGKVLFDGRPLTKGNVRFHADFSKGNATQAIPMGEIDANGNYELQTGNSKGAPPGWYRVTVYHMTSAETKKGVSPPKPPYNEKYLRDDKTPLRIEVKANAGEGAYTLHLTK
jgi:hypothetical protein